MQASEMKFRSVNGWTRLDHLTNDSICSDQKICNINHKIIVYQNKWKEHIEQLDKDRLPRKVLEYKPGGYQNHGKPLLCRIDQWRQNRLIA